MKIGIITFHRAANFGAVLQAYALQKYLVDQKNEVDIIDYRCKAIESVHSPCYFLYVKGIKNKMKQFLRLPRRLKKRKLFDDFLRRKLILSIKVNKENIEGIFQNKYDVIIAGSDQIWNPVLTNYDTAYLLDFVPDSIVRVSYAPSFGMNRLDRKCIEIYKKQMERFHKLSVREKTGIAIIKEMCVKKVSEVADPVLLLQREEWETFMEEPVYRNYILLYLLRDNERLICLGKKMAEQQNKKLIFISDSLLKKRKIKYIAFPTPEKWVGLFHNADYVVTDSFHGTLFSVMFNKKMTIGLSDLKQNGNSRIINLLNSVAIKFICCDDMIALGTETDWAIVNAKIEKLRAKSRQFLQLENVKE